MFSSIFTTVSQTITIQNTLMCAAAALVFGLIISVVYLSQEGCSKGFAVTLAVLPLIVAIVIIMVNGNMGTGIAVAGAFSLVRFRSAPGSAREIASIFFAMAIGLAVGTGFLAFAGIMTVIISAAFFALDKSPLGERRELEKSLRITIPESLDYTGIFDDIFKKYTKSARLRKVKTTNLGSMFDLSYEITLRDASMEKEMIDEIRTRNGNLTIICSERMNVPEQL